MKFNDNFEVVRVADEYLAVPTGEFASSFKGVVALNEASAFLLGKMREPISRNKLLESLVSEYELPLDVAEKDIDEFLIHMASIGLILNETT